MDKMNTLVLIKKIRSGEILSDPELNAAIKHYRNLEALVSYHGERYDVFRIEILKELSILETFKKARKS